MSLDKHHYLVAVGQFSGLLQKFPGKKDTYYGVRRGDGELYVPGRGVHSPTLRKVITSVRGYQSLIDIDRGSPPNLPSEMVGTTVCYQLLQEVVSIFTDSKMPSGYQSLVSTYKEVVLATQNISFGVMPPVCAKAQGFLEPDGLALLFKSASEELLSCYDLATASHRARKKKWKEGSSQHTCYGKFSSVTGGLFGVYSMGSLVLVRVGKVESLLTPEHFRKFARSLICFRNLSLLTSDLASRSRGATIDIMRLICRLGIKDQSHVGAGFRVLRAYVMAMASDSGTSLSNPRNDVVASFDGTKLEFGLEIIDIVRGLTDSYTELTQLGGLYKYVMSPDISMSDCFEAAYGMKEPNHPVGSAQRNFRGLLRKRVYLNLLKAKHLIHATTDDEGMRDELNKPSPGAIRLEKVPLEKWADVTFSTLRDAVTYKDVDLRVNDKSSANDLASPPLNEYAGYNLKWLKGGRSETIATVDPSKSNDVLETLKSSYKPTPTDGYQRFKSLVMRHDIMEKKLMKEGGYSSRYEIPTSQLSSVILSDPGLFYTVNTEPKEGEYHKPAGRLFYMATREMKAYISSVERLCRTLFHGQVGNSIVSSYSRREEQLRSMARSTSSKSQTFIPYFVSFDMSEFSKKFPMELVNEVGELFAELTGDKELSRLDVIFRAGVVCHSTRGYEGLFAGVKGGFEGFLNFVWTAAHVTIMELALLNTQKQGLVMAYSDDGLLEFIVDPETTLQNRRDIVAAIQKTYSNLGLSFHLFKTLVSTNVFEYLGLVAVDGRYVDTWGKALSNLGIREQRSAFTPFSDIIDTYVGQARSVVDALCPVDLIYYHMLLDIVIVCHRWVSNLHLKQLLTIIFMPRSMGGLGVPNQMELCITSERPPLEGFIHTALAFTSSGNPYFDQAVSAVLDHWAPKNEQDDAVVRGSCFSSSIPKLSGGRICSELAERVAAKAGMRAVADPLTPYIINTLLSLTKTFSNFPHPMFVRLVESSPPSQEYSRRLEVASSRGAFHFLGRNEIRYAQSRDSASVRRLFVFWKRVFSRPYTREPGEIQPVTKFIQKVNTNLIKNGFAPLRLKPETLLSASFSHENSVVYGRLDRTHTDLLCSPLKARKLDDSVYASPNMTSGSPDSTPIFDSSEGVAKSLPDKMLKLIGRMLTICPEGLENIFSIVSLLGASLPSIPAGVKGDLARLRALIKGKPSVVLKVPQTLYALSDVTYMRTFNTAIAQGRVTDYTTALMTCRALLSLFSYRMGDLSAPPENSDRRLWLSLIEGGTLEDLAYEPPVSIRTRVPEGLYVSPPQDDKHWTAKSVLSLIEEMKLRVNIISTDKESVESRRYLAHALSQRLARRIHMKLEGLPRNIIVDERLTTDDETTNAEIARLTFLEVARIELEDMRGRTGDLKTRIDDHLTRVSGLSDELPSFMNEETFHSLLKNGEYNAYVQQTRISTLVSLGRVKSVLTGPLTSPQSYRELISRSIKEMYSLLNKKSGGFSWGGTLETGPSGEAALIPSTRSQFSVDLVLDGLTAMLSSIRPSAHRATPFNQTTFVLHYAKMIIIGSRMLGFLKMSTREEAQSVVSSERLTEEEALQLKGCFPDKLGPDHSEILRSPLGPICGKRAAIYSRWRKKEGPSTLYYESRLENISKILRDGRSVQTFLRGAISHYLTNNVARIPTQVLRSAEAEHVLSGLWHMRTLYMAYNREVPVSDGLPGEDATDCLSGQIITLLRRVSGHETGVSVQLEVSTKGGVPPSSFKGFSRYRIDVYDPLSLSESPSNANFLNYPGSLGQEVGSLYYFSYRDLPPSDLVGMFARMSSFGEVVADLVADKGKHMLVGVILVTVEGDPGFGAEGGERGKQSDINTGASSHSAIDDEDLKILLGTPIKVAGQRRMCEAGLLPSLPDPLDINPPVLLARSTGVGLARQGGWEGTLVPGEPHLVRATVTSHSAASPYDFVIGSAIAWSALISPKNATPDEVRGKTLEVVASWKERIEGVAENARDFMRLGVYTEISEIATWLRTQNFQLPVIEEVSAVLLNADDVDIGGLEDAAGRITLTEFTMLKLDISYVRNVALTSASFSAMARRVVAERKGGPLLEEEGGTVEERKGGDESDDVSSMNSENSGFSNEDLWNSGMDEAAYWSGGLDEDF